jgi:hypothetical protein
MLRRAVAQSGGLGAGRGLRLCRYTGGHDQEGGCQQNTLVVTGKDKKAVNKDAKITLEGKGAKLSDLKAGQKAKVTHEDNKASTVEAKSAKEK